MYLNPIRRRLEKAMIDSEFMTTGIEILGKRLHDLRRIRWRSQKKFSDYLQEAFGMSIHQTTLSSFGRGEKFPSAENLALLARALETNTDYLLGISDDEKPASDLDDQVVFSVRSDAERKALDRVGREFLKMNEEDQKLVLELVGRLSSNGPRLIE